MPERLLNPADVELLRDALDHIMRTARASRTQTRRTRFIEKRAKLALDGVPYSPRDFDLPKMTPVQTALDTAKRQNMALRFNYREMLGALRDAESFISGFEDDQSQVGIPELLERLRAALNLATAACHQEVAA
ncbi:hypothetical protein RAN3_2504 [plant metagenome]|uniref:Uncharacterized protein n=1 Tax=plant metagenome TaxID=1297885 RepID=A0A484U3T5_9ZZZZ